MDRSRGFPSLFCGGFNPHHPSWWGRADPSDTADQLVALVENEGFVLDNVPHTPTYFQRGTQSALGLVWSRDTSTINWRTIDTVGSDHKCIASTLNAVRGQLLTPSIPTFSRLFCSWPKANWRYFSTEARKAVRPLGEASRDV
ncbi:putative guanine nucleotide-binding protein beta subunit-like protein putative G-protein (beta)-like protein [Leptomonas seymouri]|uniref:Putative guanine nucleotide-binding protein beta subunit-like protein putative G-protein (Beta)-like protein n=1 Tax=Leptomonas seymouri TaxID=5684 RepID=A0A0N0P267_LEPSE|nr:putative guanine nucleotide-binding protein beta subunit-like protein putative G-protein (beta)-like protein [Leptomonas seymouri]|eukprot:KPI82596.1 putative guanine nucleotide-binding protein beta subunit-like protein putative G-protein (beta)-like protein [Leptomonas seymouri]